jgi:hypothetical protein
MHFIFLLSDAAQSTINRHLSQAPEQDSLRLSEAPTRGGEVLLVTPSNDANPASEWKCTKRKRLGP